MKEAIREYKLISSLVYPLKPEDFFSKFYDKQPKYFAGNFVHKCDKLISTAKLDDLIANSELPPASIDMARHEPPISKSNFTFKSGNIDRGAVIRHFQEGATIIFPQLNLASEELADFCRALEYELSCKVQTNVYLTPKTSQGFKTHYDDHDVFVIQVEGSKKWSVYQQAIERPFRGEPFKASEYSAGDTNLSFTMHPGDCAYIPRGYMHDAVNVGDQPSLHITVGLLVKKWAEFMLEVLSEVAIDNPKFRESMPIGFARRGFNKDNALVHFNELMSIFSEEANFEEVFEVFKDELYRTRKANIKGALIQSSASIEVSDLYVLREKFQASLSIENDNAILSCAGGDLKFEAKAYEALRQILGGAPFAAELFDGFDRIEAIEMVQKLLAFGAITLFVDLE